MVDIIPTVAALLSEICPVELQFPHKSAEFPMIPICEIANQSDVVLDGRERLSVISVQADVWDDSKTPARAAEIAAKVNAVMVSKGFKRVFGQFMPDGDLQRKCMRFTAKIDELNNRVYNP